VYICVLILVLCRVCMLILVFGVLMQLNRLVLCRKCVLILVYVCMLILVFGVLMQLNRLAAKYTSDSYDVLNCNCNHFTEDLCMAICGVQVHLLFLLSIFCCLFVTGRVFSRVYGRNIHTQRPRRLLLYQCIYMHVCVSD
jgi:hypothetical protein